MANINNEKLIKKPMQCESVSQVPHNHAYAKTMDMMQNFNVVEITHKGYAKAVQNKFYSVVIL